MDANSAKKIHKYVKTSPNNAVPTPGSSIDDTTSAAAGQNGVNLKQLTGSKADPTQSVKIEILPHSHLEVISPGNPNQGNIPLRKMTYVNSKVTPDGSTGIEEQIKPQPHLQTLSPESSNEAGASLRKLSYVGAKLTSESPPHTSNDDSGSLKKMTYVHTDSFSSRTVNKENDGKFATEKDETAELVDDSDAKKIKKDFVRSSPSGTPPLGQSQPGIKTHEKLGKLSPSASNQDGVSPRKLHYVRSKVSANSSSSDKDELEKLPPFPDEATPDLETLENLVKPQGRQTTIVEEPHENRTSTDAPKRSKRFSERFSRVSFARSNEPETRRVHFNHIHEKHSFMHNTINTGKYTIATFLPIFLFEQLRKAFNLFFLCVSALQQIPDVSPTGRYTTIGPLTAILMVAAIKEIVEDYKRHRQDDITNNRTVEKYSVRGKIWKKKKWSEIHVGDIIKVLGGQFFPADLVLLSSSEPKSMCYIETANLDGETNLKIRQGPTPTVDVHTLEDVSNMKGYIECEGPNRDLYTFTGNLKLDDSDKSCPLSPEQILLRGAMLRNTHWVYGVVIYTGHESKLMKNANRMPLKMSNVDRLTNRQIFFLFIILVTISVASTIGSWLWKNEVGNKWYMPSTYNTVLDSFLEVLTFMILYNNLVPISLLVTLELVKFIQAGFINCDRDMYFEETETPAMARTSNLNEELGQVKYIFSDKTGTLTQNRMVFKKCCVAGIKYDSSTNDSSEFNDPAFLEKLHSDLDSDKSLRQFALSLALCHTVVPEHVDDESEPDTKQNDSDAKATGADIEYQSSSPDENALVKAARSMGYVFVDRTPTHVVIDALGVQEKYEVLNVLEFSSTRKRMSTIYRYPDGSIILLCKGADNVIYERLAKMGYHYKRETDLFLEQFAEEGLRTLCIAYAKLDEKAYQEWNASVFYAASTAVVDRENKLAHAYSLVEKDLHLIGASAIEDKLQDGVPETIATLARADIKIWVLTGDKQETAINIAHSCNLIQHNMLLCILQETTLKSTEARLKEAACEVAEEQLKLEHEYALIVTGMCLQHCLDSELQPLFVKLALSCKAVICCRVSPLQKAEIVELVKLECKAITLAIGDGANDVSMIQAAHVGIGISGFEGLQAANSSDYSIAQFAYLQKLLLVHGAWNYTRLAKCILFSFYKNICLYLIELWFLFYNGFSGQILFDRWTITLYNLIFTALPPFTLGLFERTCSMDVMMKHPQLYSMSQGAVKYNTSVFWQMFLNATVHSFLLFFIPVLCFSHEVYRWDGKPGGYLYFGNFIFSYVVVTVCLKAGLESGTWTAFTSIAVWGSILAWFLVFGIYSVISPSSLLGADMTGQAENVLTCPLFWAGFFLVPTAVLFRDFVWKVLRRILKRTVVDEVQELEKACVDPTRSILAAERKNPKRRPTFLDFDVLEKVPSKSFQQAQDPVHGYAFSQEEHGAVSQSDLIRRYDSTMHHNE